MKLLQITLFGCLKRFSPILSALQIFPHTNPVRRTIVISTDDELGTGKLLTLNHIASKLYNWDLNPSHIPLVEEMYYLPFRKRMFPFILRFQTVDGICTNLLQLYCHFTK